MSIFTILKQPLAIPLTVSPILIKVTNDHFIFYILKINRSLAKTDIVFVWSQYDGGNIDKEQTNTKSLANKND